VQIITLTTDFGTQDWFVGTMKGVILGIAPHAAIVDITHEIPTGDIQAGHPGGNGNGGNDDQPTTFY
jgi:S-adenosylmethionine hydrolase